MAKQKFKPVAATMSLVGILVALAVGFGMTSGILVVPFIPGLVTVVAGWIVVIATIAGAIMGLMEFMK